MNKIITLALGAVLVGCSAHAHSRLPAPAPPPSLVHNPAPPTSHNESVQAWVWVSAHYAHNIWVRGHWALRTVPRYTLSRYPHTHVRYVRGHAHPAPPRHRHRRHHRHR